MLYMPTATFFDGDYDDHARLIRPRIERNQRQKQDLAPRTPHTAC